MNNSLQDEILKLKEEKNAIILAHNYQPQEIQEIADFLGDSLELCIKASEIEDKDLVVIKKQSTASVGDIVVALDEDSQNTLKTFDGIDDSSGYAILKYENRRKYKNKVIRVRELVVQGVAKHVIKAL